MKIRKINYEDQEEIKINNEDQEEIKINNKGEKEIMNIRGNTAKLNP